MKKAAASSHSQRTISAYFASSPSPQKKVEKRPAAAVVDLTVDDDDNDAAPRPPVAKKSKKASEPCPKSQAAAFFTPDPLSPLSRQLPQAGPSRPKTPPPPSATHSVDAYRFVPQTSPHFKTSDDASLTTDQSKAKKARREAFKRKLLEDNTIFKPRSRTTPPDDDAAMDIDDLKNIKAREDDEESMLEQSDNESVSFPEFITSKSYTSTASKTKSKASKSSANGKGKGKQKEDDEVGPSGQTYTPLEKQVRV